MNLKTPLKLQANKPSAFGFVSGEIRDAENNCVMSGLFRDQETAAMIVDCLNQHANTASGVAAGGLDSGLVASGAAAITQPPEADLDV